MVIRPLFNCFPKWVDIRPYSDFVQDIINIPCIKVASYDIPIPTAWRLKMFSLGTIPKKFRPKFKLLRNDSSDVEDEYVLYPGKTFYCQIDVETNELENMCPGLCVGGCSYSMTPMPIDETCIPKKLSIFNDKWKKSTSESAPVVALECSGKQS